MKYCTNCGKKINEGADFCLGCGKNIKNLNKKEKITVKNDNINIFGMVFGIIAFYIICILSEDLESIYLDLLNEPIELKFIYMCAYTMFSYIPAIPGLILSIVGIKEKKSIYGIIGLITSIVTLVYIIELTIFMIS